MSAFVSSIWALHLLALALHVDQFIMRIMIVHNSFIIFIFVFFIIIIIIYIYYHCCYSYLLFLIYYYLLLSLNLIFISDLS